MLIDEVSQKPGFWSSSGPKSDIVLSSRIRLARNIHSLPFPAVLEENESYIIRHSIERFASESRYSGNVRLIDLKRLEDHEKRFLRERNIITHEMETSPKSLVLLSSGEDFTILVNEQDHYRIQVIKPGLQIEEAYRLADTVDDELNRFVFYAYSEDYGYLTASPANLGTGLRCSMLLHLPALAFKNRIGEMVPYLKERGVDLRGTVGENRKTIGSIFQISNRTSLGLSEVDIIEIMDSAANVLVSTEDSLRDETVLTSRVKLEDRVFRSLGILRYARTVSYGEAMEHLSNVRFGVILAFIKGLEIHVINDMMVNIQRSHLQNYFGETIVSNGQCDRLRAEYISAMLRNIGER
ncbi:MAG TPA: ATP--guanido phosphotransferase [Spirochaetota bacterium]|nr:ATP--guanido phosphotransferase [Spirochaetota bacterium]HRZ27958.1 ATP--guanido phosphotransferase [Spirochaetota bacterium]HSA13190.1 ATP--guanido phosphotransferase [Spirochaetota bacterium]